MKRNYKILFVNPGASVTGAPILFINMVSWLKENSTIIPFILTSGSGPLEYKFRELAPLYKWDGCSEKSRYDNYYIFRLMKRIFKKIGIFSEIPYKVALFEILKNENFDLIYSNSVASCNIILELKQYLSCKVICHIRELEISIQQFCGIELFHLAIPKIDLFIADSESVRMNLVSNHNVDEEKVKKVYEYIIYADSEKIITGPGRKDENNLRKDLGIPDNAFVVASCGTTDWRKGADLVVFIAKEVAKKSIGQIHFIWIGGDNTGIEFQKLYYDIVRLNLKDNIHFLGIKSNPLEYFIISDVFMLCSREEPVGIVALEAASLGKPILCFDRAGGMREFVEENCGFILPYLDIDSMAEHIIKLENDRDLLHTLGENAARKVKQHDINIACKEIEEIIYSVIES
jgi:glycosyltransferase involved in cell wall biosynthesis